MRGSCDRPRACHSCQFAGVKIYGVSLGAERERHKKGMLWIATCVGGINGDW